MEPGHFSYWLIRAFSTGIFFEMHGWMDDFSRVVFLSISSWSFFPDLFPKATIKEDVYKASVLHFCNVSFKKCYDESLLRFLFTSSWVLNPFTSRFSFKTWSHNFPVFMSVWASTKCGEYLWSYHTALFTIPSSKDGRMSCFRSFPSLLFKAKPFYEFFLSRHVKSHSLQERNMLLIHGPVMWTYSLSQMCFNLMQYQTDKALRML